MREIVRTEAHPCEPALVRAITEGVGKVLGTDPVEGFMDCFFTRLGDEKKIPVDDVVEKVRILKGKETRTLVHDGWVEPMTMEEIRDYLDEWASKRGKESMRERARLMFTTFFSGQGKRLVEDVLSEGGGAWLAFDLVTVDNRKKLVPVPDPAWVADPENPLPHFRDCLPVTKAAMHEYGCLIGCYGMLSMRSVSKKRVERLAAALDDAIQGVFPDPEEDDDVAAMILPVVNSWKDKDPVYMEKLLGEMRDMVAAFSDRREKEAATMPAPAL